MSPAPARSLQRTAWRRRLFGLRPGAVALVSGVLSSVLVARWLLGDTGTRLEARAIAWVAGTLGQSGVYEVAGTNLLRGDHQGTPYLVRVTESCSSLTAGVTLIGLSFLILRGSTGQRVVGAAAACAVVVFGNVTRILAVVWVGNTRGIDSLVAFHDWFGTAYSTVYLTVAFVVLIASRLPSRRQWLRLAPRTYGL